MKMTIDLTPEQVAAFNKLKTTRQGKTDAELFCQVVDRGIYDLNYRSTRNKLQWQAFKEWKQTQKSE
jgi:hypothetical protein